MYMHIYTQTYIYTYTYIYTCTHTRIPAHTSTYACICTRMHRWKILATTPQRVKQYHWRTYAFIYICMHIHIYMHTHICAQPAVSVFADVNVGVKTHLCNVHTCPCTSAKNNCSKMHATLTAKKMHIYIYLHTYAYAYICIRTHMSDDTETHNLCTNMHTHIHTHVFKRIHIHIHTHMHIYTNIHVRTYTHTHIYTHTHTKCTYAVTQARLERQRDSDRARGWCRRGKPCTSLSFDAIKPHLATPMLGLHCTHFLRHQYPSTPHPLFPTYPRTVRKNGP